jgi:putative hemolysin
MHTRFPICAVPDDPQSIEGYINFKDIVAAMRVNPSDPTIKGIARPIKKVNENMPLSQLLEVMMRERNHIVLVTSSEGIVLGMVTLEDIIEELVGEIEDEFDRLPSHIHPYGSSSWIMGGGVSMLAAASAAGFDWWGKFSDGRIPTLAEWCAQKAGQPLKGGEVIESDGLRVAPRKFRRKKVSEAMVTVPGR